MKQRFGAVAGYSPGENGTTLPPFFAHFHDSGGGELLEAGLQFGGEFHKFYINDIVALELSFLGLNE